MASLIASRAASKSGSQLPNWLHEVTLVSHS
jgi:hypothetical protein